MLRNLQRLLPLARVSLGTPFARRFSSIAIPASRLQAVLRLIQPKSFFKAESEKKEQTEQKSQTEQKTGDGKNDQKIPPPPPPPQNFWEMLKSNIPLVGLLIALVITSSIRPSDGVSMTEISWQDFKMHLLKNNLVESLKVINGSKVRVVLKPNVGNVQDVIHGVPSSSPVPPADGQHHLQQNRVLFFQIGSISSFETKLEKAQVEFGIPQSERVPVSFVHETSWGSELLKLAPTLLLVVGWIWIMRRMSGGGAGGKNGLKGIFSVGKSNAQVFKQGDIKTTFKDVAGLGEAKAEIMEFVEFLKTPGKFQKLGAKIPRGALLVGPPGTGKTLLGKAVAGEAGVPFFSISGSDFVEMFVGVGPSRVRDLFTQARSSAPCIVFIDEIDAIGRHRGKGFGVNDERENTLNQLLVEMDGLKALAGVIVLAGTNRADVLDPALTRAGRFDRHIFVDKPDLQARQQIFEVHLKPLKLVDPPESYSRRLAGLTPGMSGAEIANVCNEAALHAARTEKKAVDFVDFQYAVDRVIAGLERKSRVLSPNEKRTVAYHEAGHAVVGWFLEHCDPVLKVSIVPRGAAALGFTMYLPRDQHLHSQEQMMDMVCMTLGGRAAEQIFFEKASTGAADDLDRVTRSLYAQIGMLGMDPEFGPISYPPPKEGEMQLYKPYSETTAEKIDDRVRIIVQEAYQRTLALLTEKKEAVIKLAEALLQKEVLSQEDVITLIGSRPHKTNYESFVYGEKGYEGSDQQKQQQKIDEKTVNGDVKTVNMITAVGEVA